jgi:saccharopine dehydrogenase-like NADP-dependent oxidoreductase
VEENYPITHPTQEELKMKILFVGGCGAQARPGINWLLGRDVFDEFVIGDINIELAKQMVKELGDARVSARKIDAFDHDGMVEVMSDADVVMNCSGPYHLLGVRVLKAAIDAGKNFVDYCDDVTPTLEMLELSEQAREKGITAIIGLGASPGILNLIAREAADKLDATREVNMYWCIGKGEPEGPAVLDHTFDIMDGDVLQFLDGQEVLVPALSGTQEEVDMPGGYGRLPTAYVGHPEPVTLPRYIPGLQKVVSKYAATPEELGFFQGLQELGMLRKEPITVRGQQVSPRDLLVTLIASADEHELAPGDIEKSAVLMDVIGTLDGEERTLRYTVIGYMAPLTSIPTAIGAELLARGEIAEKGVLPPEACVSPDSVLIPLCELDFVELTRETL